MLDPSVLEFAEGPTTITPPPTGKRYYNEVLADVPWLYWLGGEPSGLATDWGVSPAPVNHNGTFSSNITRNVLPGLTGDGRSCWAEVGGGANPAALSYTGLAHAGVPQTFELLVQQTVTPLANGDILFGAQRTGFGGSTYWLSGGVGTTDFKFNAILYAVPVTVVTWPGTVNALTDMAVHQVTMTIIAAAGASADCELFIDGVSKGVQNGANLQQLRMDNFYAGSDPPVDGSFCGNLQDPHIYQFQLSNARIAAHFASIGNS
jgi:hypothetical protein